MVRTILKCNLVGILLGNNMVVSKQNNVTQQVIFPSFSYYRFSNHLHFPCYIAGNHLQTVRRGARSGYMVVDIRHFKFQLIKKGRKCYVQSAWQYILPSSFSFCQAWCVQPERLDICLYSCLRTTIDLHLFCDFCWNQCVLYMRQ